MRVPGVGGPRAVLRAAIDRMAAKGIAVDEVARIVTSALGDLAIAVGATAPVLQHALGDEGLLTAAPNGRAA